MRNIVFHCAIYWDLHWMHRVIRTLGSPVYTESDQVKKLCAEWDIPVVNTMNGFDTLIVTNMHLHSHQQVQSFRADGRKVIVMQHAWDSFLNLRHKFWGVDMTNFDYYLVGSKQDYDIMSADYGDKIVLTGMPHLDDLYDVKKSHKDLSFRYAETKDSNFYLSIGPTRAISEQMEREYCRLPTQTATHIVFKLHPGGSFSQQTVDELDRFNHATFLDDDQDDPFHTYELIKLSKAVVCVESFMSIEASLMEKPVIFWGREELPTDFYQKEENTMQIVRAPADMSSSLENPQYRERQREIASLYLFDGKNTNRCVDFLKGLV